MFNGVNRDGTETISPHRYQVILEAAFTAGAVGPLREGSAGSP
jgi:hypothetical protein